MSVKLSEYIVDGKKFSIYDTEDHKVVRSEEYNRNFNKKTGKSVRWGKTVEDDPNFSPIGPEILDIEVSQNGCHARCPFCSPAKTPVNTVFGEKDIEAVVVGDIVFGYNGYAVEEQKVVETYSRDYSGELICIELENGVVLRLTPEHEIFLKDGRTIQAQNLTESDEIIYFDEG